MSLFLELVRLDSALPRDFRISQGTLQKSEHSDIVENRLENILVSRFCCPLELVNCGEAQIKNDSRTHACTSTNAKVLRLD